MIDGIINIANHLKIYLKQQILSSSFNIIMIKAGKIEVNNLKITIPNKQIDAIEKESQVSMFRLSLFNLTCPALIRNIENIKKRNCKYRALPSHPIHIPMDMTNWQNMQK